MTNYNDWDRKAEALCKEAEEEEKREKEENDAALGLQDGPQGPATAKAKQQRKEMEGHSDKRKDFIASIEAKELNLTHSGCPEPVVVTAAEASGKAVRIKGSQDVTYQLEKGMSLIKVYVERCRNVKVHLSCQLMTSFLEVNHCSDVEIRTELPISTIQCDECDQAPVRIVFLEPEGVGNLIHQNSPSLEVSVPGQEVARIGAANGVQIMSRPSPKGGFENEDIVRGEKDYPVNLFQARGGVGPSEPEAEKPPSKDEKMAAAEEKRNMGNEAFRANDFLQAAVYYTEAINQCDELHLAWANRAQCFLKTGQLEKALQDATRCTELAPDYAKGWFRKGMALHALERYAQAIPAFGEAEKLDPRNPQIPDAIKMAQMMCRKKGPGDSA